MWGVNVIVYGILGYGSTKILYCEYMVLEWSSSRYSRSRFSLWRILQSEFPSQQIDYFEISFDGEPEVELLKLLFIVSLPKKAYNEFECKIVHPPLK